jgi:hypothetical protein
VGLAPILPRREEITSGLTMKLHREGGRDLEPEVRLSENCRLTVAQDGKGEI